MSKRAGSKGGAELERLVEAWLEVQGWKVHRAAPAGLVQLAGGGHFTRSNDLFGCFDFLACTPWERATGAPGPDEQTWAIQATAPDNRSPRRAKIEAAGPWPRSWRVSIVHHVSERVGRETRHFFIVEDRDPFSGKWSEPAAVAVDLDALLAFRSAKARAKREGVVRQVAGEIAKAAQTGGVA